MMYAVTLMVGIIAGYLMCYFASSQTTQKPRKPQEEEEGTILVKRSKPSLRSPLQTNRIAYDKYRTTGGLLSPVKPKGNNNEDVEISR